MIDRFLSPLLVGDALTGLDGVLFPDSQLGGSTWDALGNKDMPIVSDDHDYTVPDTAVTDAAFGSHPDREEGGDVDVFISNLDEVFTTLSARASQQGS